jgi:arylformamidase
MIVDLSHEIAAGMTTYPGIAGPRLEVTVSRAASAARLGSGASFEIESLTLAGNTGTALPAPVRAMASFPVRAVAIHSG